MTFFTCRCNISKNSGKNKIDIKIFNPGFHDLGYGRSAAGFLSQIYSLQVAGNLSSRSGRQVAQVMTR